MPFLGMSEAFLPALTILPHRPWGLPSWTGMTERSPPGPIICSAQFWSISWPALPEVQNIVPPSYLRRLRQSCLPWPTTW